MAARLGSDGLWDRSKDAASATVDAGEGVAVGCHDLGKMVEALEWLGVPGNGSRSQLDSDASGRQRRRHSSGDSIGVVATMLLGKAMLMGGFAQLGNGGSGGWR
ncbi:hypothetical protein E2562_028426 [Oryza meyeriana var. granulata]|uniref:Uncharacterized protein n=1 Tax=Oryza meyeriana var. granulata TaxID=110450 RepID=A0A6G1EQM5_9ORYZ|nr:hypothetical protein E2562_028426 [Oryza meyeriana var. granulata]